LIVSRLARISYTTEADNFSDRGVETAFGRAPGATRSLLAFGISTRVSPRWTLNADYSYRILVNGAPKNDPVLATGACCLGAVGAETCSVVTEATCIGEGGIFAGLGTACSATACTLGAPPAAVSVVTVVFDEQAHTVNVGGSYQVTTASSPGAPGYSYISYEDDLFGEPVLETAPSAEPHLRLGRGARLHRRDRGWGAGQAWGATTIRARPRSGAVPTTFAERDVRHLRR
jgi:hypothetical protein